MIKIIPPIFIIWLLLVFTVVPYTCATRERIGAQCCDETMTDATGSGACSGHGGVMCWEYKYWYDKPEYKDYKKVFKAILPVPGRFDNCKSCDE